MAAGIDKGALRPLPGQREYLGLVAQLYVAAAAGQHAALAQEAQLCSEALNRTVNTAQQSRIVSERIFLFFKSNNLFYDQFFSLGSGSFLDFNNMEIKYITNLKNLR